MGKGFDVSGFGDLDLALAQLKTATAKAALRRALKTAAQPLADTMRALAPDDPTTDGTDLRASIVVGSRLTPRQAGLHKELDGRAAVEVFVGSGGASGARGSDPAAIQQEFGNILHGPQPFARPAWDREKHTVASELAAQMRLEIEKSIARVNKKSSRNG